MLKWQVVERHQAEHVAGCAWWRTNHYVETWLLVKIAEGRILGECVFVNDRWSARDEDGEVVGRFVDQWSAFAALEKEILHGRDQQE
jgi:hypothetical protein